MPGEQRLGGTVIASVHYADGEDCEDGLDRYTVVTLMPRPPFYKVSVVSDDRAEGLQEEWVECHRNIVPAIIGDHPEMTDPPAMVFPRDHKLGQNGYVDMGGDY